MEAYLKREKFQDKFSDEVLERYTKRNFREIDLFSRKIGLTKRPSFF